MANKAQLGAITQFETIHVGKSFASLYFCRRNILWPLNQVV